MSTWMVVTSVWAMLALCAVLFVRGASLRHRRMEDFYGERDADGNHTSSGSTSTFQRSTPLSERSTGCHARSDA
ncbi:hypothetical protein AWB76_00548 [Caballeronia temeraria]|uniref:Uncharacterized protein n=1 Tax=Caballeronia temeraria TaxID=1777137 RepID=A0A157ZEF1_9BURK|nr:hypothetical protein AWB76_00548 [Caballeronia temeraria]